MYVTVRGASQTDGGQPPLLSEAELGETAARRRHIPLAEPGLGTVSLLTNISSESFAAVLPPYITVVRRDGKALSDLEQFTTYVDAQVEWLDNRQVLYGLPRPVGEGTISDVWAAADGSGQPHVIISQASSPAVVVG